VSNTLSIIVLAGGFGTRLQPIIGRTAKILASIQGTPFIDYLVAWITRSLGDLDYSLYFATGFCHEEVERYVLAMGIRASTIRETKPLGTLGASAAVAREAATEHLLILNGDTLFDCNLLSAFDLYLLDPSLPLLLTKNSGDGSRFGGYNLNHETQRLAPSNGSVSDLISLGAVFTTKSLLINYCNQALANGISQPMMDNDFLYYVQPRNLSLDNSIHFIDIGVPESFSHAQSLIPSRHLL